MFNFISKVKNTLEEQGKSIQNLFDDNIVSKNTFYKYKQRYPSLETLIKITNYLEVSIDYLFEYSNENKFKIYHFDNQIFYENLNLLINKKGISGRQFCKDLNYSRDNLIRWKKGIKPSVQTLIEISKYFQCLIDELILK
ncbi:MAG: helix-turn-helix transcriptional regulator [Clostridia bacterium]|nr:helix-turn-helix transcriptional regulator [Clostridia bacterium]